MNRGTIESSRRVIVSGSSYWICPKKNGSCGGQRITKSTVGGADGETTVRVKLPHRPRLVRRFVPAARRKDFSVFRALRHGVMPPSGSFNRSLKSANVLAGQTPCQGSSSPSIRTKWIARSRSMDTNFARSTYLHNTAVRAGGTDTSSGVVTMPEASQPAPTRPIDRHATAAKVGKAAHATPGIKQRKTYRSSCRIPAMPLSPGLVLLDGAQEWHPAWAVGWYPNACDGEAPREGRGRARVRLAPEQRCPASLPTSSSTDTGCWLTKERNDFYPRRLSGVREDGLAILMARIAVATCCNPCDRNRNLSIRSAAWSRV